MSAKYLLLKLAEEAGEVVVAAMKHRLHRTSSTRRELSKEIGDLLAVVKLLNEFEDINNKITKDQYKERYVRERERCKSR